MPAPNVKEQNNISLLTSIGGKGHQDDLPGTPGAADMQGTE